MYVRSYFSFYAFVAIVNVDYLCLNFEVKILSVLIVAQFHTIQPSCRSCHWQVHVFKKFKVFQLKETSINI